MDTILETVEEEDDEHNEESILLTSEQTSIAIHKGLIVKHQLQNKHPVVRCFCCRIPSECFLIGMSLFLLGVVVFLVIFIYTYYHNLNK
jgi:hypothetical protein